MNILYADYNKVSDAAFAVLGKQLEGLKLDLPAFGEQINVLSTECIDVLLKVYDFDVIMVGDIFWPTGQNICDWSKRNNKVCCFLQHGQWIYIDNKKNPQHVPSCTFLFGGHVYDMVQTWPYAKRSRVEVVGNPRYDNLTITESEDFLYFAPPVILEQIEGTKDRLNEVARQSIVEYKNLDKEINLMIHPHYREGGIDILKGMFPNAQFIDVHDDPLPYVLRCKSVLTHRNSTTVLDAIACHKLSVIMDKPSFYKKGYFGPFAYEALNMKDVILGFDKEVEVYNYEEEAYPYICLGNASERIRNVVQSGF